MVFFYLGLLFFIVGLFLYVFNEWFILNVSSLKSLEKSFKLHRGTSFLYKLIGYVVFILGFILVVVSYLLKDVANYNIKFLSNNDVLVFFWNFFVNGGWIAVFIFLFVLFVGMSYGVWILSTRLSFVNKHKYITLEMSVPKFNEKGPEAMEQFLNALIKTYTKSEWTSPDWIDVAFKGAIPLWYSFEIVSIEGKIVFQMGIPIEMKNVVETNFYSVYPDSKIEIVQPAKDHILKLPENFPNHSFNIWGRELKLKSKDIFPIRTYGDFSSDSNPDPLNGLLEVIGKIGKGEYIGFQILLQSMPDNRWKMNAEGYKSDNSDKKSAVEKKISKNLFKSRMRVLYIARKDVYRAEQVKVALLSSFSQFNSNFNEVEGSKKYYTEVTGPAKFLKLFSGIWPFSFFVKKISGIRSELLIKSYKMRDFGFYIQEFPFVLNVEEVATLFHMPTQYIKSPKVNWLDTRKTEPPSNLPLGEKI